MLSLRFMPESFKKICSDMLSFESDSRKFYKSHLSTSPIPYPPISSRHIKTTSLHSLIIKTLQEIRNRFHMTIFYKSHLATYTVTSFPMSSFYKVSMQYGNIFQPSADLNLCRYNVCSSCYFFLFSLALNKLRKWF